MLGGVTIAGAWHAGSNAGLAAVAGDAAAARGLVSLLGAHHHSWAVQLAMQWMELVMRLLPQAAAALRALGAWDALQLHQFRSGLEAHAMP